MEEHIFLPTLSHWEFGNGWSGSRGNACFLVRPEEGALCAELWTGPLCRAMSEAEESASFPVSEDGIEQLRTWLEEQSARRGGGAP